MRPATRTRLAGLSVFAALAVVGLGVAAWSGAFGGPIRHVPLPPRAAGPQRVVGVYLRALESRDFATARSLVAPRSRADFAPWLTGPAKLADARVVGSDPYTGPNGPHPGEIWVSVRFTLDHSDGSMPLGPTHWGYVLAKPPRAGARWLIVDQGTG